MTSGFGLEKSRDVKSRQMQSRSANRKGTVKANNPKNLRSTEETGEWAENTEHGIVTEVQNDYRVKKHLLEEVNEKMSLLFYDFNSSQRQQKNTANPYVCSTSQGQRPTFSRRGDRLPTRERMPIGELEGPK